MTDVTLDFLAKQMDHLIAETRSMRDDMTVMMEILRGQTHAITSMTAQLADMHSYNRRMLDRVSKLEEKIL